MPQITNSLDQKLQICSALGLDVKNIAAVTISFDARGPIIVETVTLLRDDQMDGLARVIKNYVLVERAL